MYSRIDQVLRIYLYSRIDQVLRIYLYSILFSDIGKENPSLSNSIKLRKLLIFLLHFTNFNPITIHFFHFFTFSNFFWCKGKGGGRTNGGSVIQKTSEMVNNLFINWATWLRYIYLKSPWKIDMCHMLIFVKNKNNYFWTNFRRTFWIF